MDAAALNQWLAKLPPDAVARVDVCEDCEQSAGACPQMTCALIFREVRNESGAMERQACPRKLAKYLREPSAQCPHRNATQRAKFAAAVPLPPRGNIGVPYQTPTTARAQRDAARRHVAQRRGKREKQIRFQTTQWKPGQR